MRKPWCSKAMWIGFLSMLIGVVDGFIEIVPECFQDTGRLPMVMGIIVGCARAIKSNISLKE